MWVLAAFLASPAITCVLSTVDVSGLFGFISNRVNPEKACQSYTEQIVCSVQHQAGEILMSQNMKMNFRDFSLHYRCWLNRWFFLSVLGLSPHIYTFLLPESKPLYEYFWQRQTALLPENRTSASWSLRSTMTDKRLRGHQCLLLSVILHANFI